MQGAALIPPMGKHDRCLMTESNGRSLLAEPTPLSQISEELPTARPNKGRAGFTFLNTATPRPRTTAIRRIGERVLWCEVIPAKCLPPGMPLPPGEQPRGAFVSCHRTSPLVAGHREASTRRRSMPYYLRRYSRSESYGRARRQSSPGAGSPQQTVTVDAEGVWCGRPVGR